MDVPWPLQKLLAVIAGFVTLLLVEVLTTSAAPAGLGGANRCHRNRFSSQGALKAFQSLEH